MLLSMTAGIWDRFGVRPRPTHHTSVFSFCLQTKWRLVCVRAQWCIADTSHWLTAGPTTGMCYQAEGQQGRKPKDMRMKRAKRPHQPSVLKEKWWLCRTGVIPQALSTVSPSDCPHKLSGKILWQYLWRTFCLASEWQHEQPNIFQL